MPNPVINISRGTNSGLISIIAEDQYPNPGFSRKAIEGVDVVDTNVIRMDFLGGKDVFIDVSKHDFILNGVTYTAGTQTVAQVMTLLNASDVFIEAGRAALLTAMKVIYRNNTQIPNALNTLENAITGDIKIPANIIGKNGRIEITIVVRGPSASTTPKYTRLKMNGAAAFYQQNWNGASTTYLINIVNRDSLTTQLISASYSNPYGGSGTNDVVTNGSFNFAIDNNLRVFHQNQVGTDAVTYERIEIIAWP